MHWFFGWSLSVRGGMERLPVDLFERVVSFLPDHRVIGRSTATHRAPWRAHQTSRRYTEACWTALLTHLEEIEDEELRRQDEAELRRHEEERVFLADFLSAFYEPGAYSDDD